jgi:hypothetical protein
MNTVPDQQPEGHHGGGDRVVRVDVIPLGSLDAVTFTFRVMLTVRQAAAEAADKLGYRAKDPGFKNADRVELNPDQTLAEAGVNDGYVLYLIDTAGGQ